MSSPQTKNPPETDTPKPKHCHPPENSMAIWVPLLGVTLVAVLVVIIAWRHIQVSRERNESSRVSSQIYVDVISAKRDSKPHDLILPGDIQAFLVASLYARTNGYVKKWYTDIGAQVKEGDLMAELEAPDVDAQLRQSVANLGQARANLEIARLSFEREKDLKQKQVVSDQEFDQARTTFEAQGAAVKSGEANVQNLQVQQGFQKITAPFTGVVTKRLVDIGALVSAGSGNAGTLLFNVAQSDPLRVFVYVPQTNAPDIHEGQEAKILVDEYPGRDFTGTVARTAGAIDPTSRTLLTEVDIPNHDGALYAGMYGQVKFTLKQENPPILIPSNVFMFRTEGTQVAVVKDGKIHFQTVKIGRDLGAFLQVTSGIDDGMQLVVNPTDDLREGSEVQVKQSAEKATGAEPATPPPHSEKDKTSDSATSPPPADKQGDKK